MSDPREELREAIARAILTPDESYYSDESLFDTDWFERELALHRADCVLRVIDVNKDLVLAVMEGKPEWNDLDELPERRQVDDDLPTDAGGRRQAVEEAIQRAHRDLPWQEHLAGDDHGGKSSVFLSAQPMSPTMRQAVEEAKQRPPARHFEPSTLFEDGERTTCATCDDSGMVTISGRPEDGPDPCPDCWPEDGER